MSTIIRGRRRRQGYPADVYLSDFMSETGTPLQWAVAWEAITEREYAEATLRLAVFVSALSGWPVASIVAAVASIRTEA